MEKALHLPESVALLPNALDRARLPPLLPFCNVAKRLPPKDDFEGCSLRHRSGMPSFSHDFEEHRYNMRSPPNLQFPSKKNLHTVIFSAPPSLAPCDDKRVCLLASEYDDWNLEFVTAAGGTQAIDCALPNTSMRRLGDVQIPFAPMSYCLPSGVL